MIIRKVDVDQREPGNDDRRLLLLTCENAPTPVIDKGSFP
jgi:hypothetical protein